MLSPAVPRAGNSGLHPRTIVSGLNWYIGKMPTGRVVPSRAEHTETTGIGDLRLIVRNAVATLLYAVPGADTVDRGLRLLRSWRMEEALFFWFVAHVARAGTDAPV